MRITPQKTKQFIATNGETVNPSITPDRLELFNEDGSPFSGLVGPRGPTGPMGPTGEVGPEGPMGPQGPLGFNAAWGLLDSQTLETEAPKIEFTSIPSAYTDLMLRVFLRSTLASSEDKGFLNFNGDVAGNYYYMKTRIAHMGFSRIKLLGGGNFEGDVTAASDPDNLFTMQEWKIFGYSTVGLQKRVFMNAIVPLHASADIFNNNIRGETLYGVWNNVSVINAIKLSIPANGGNLAIGCQAKLYGRA